MSNEKTIYAIQWLCGEDWLDCNPCYQNRRNLEEAKEMMNNINNSKPNVKHRIVKRTTIEEVVE